MPAPGLTLSNYHGDLRIGSVRSRPFKVPHNDAQLLRQLIHDVFVALPVTFRACSDAARNLGMPAIDHRNQPSDSSDDGRRRPDVK